MEVKCVCGDRTEIALARVFQRNPEGWGVVVFTGKCDSCERLLELRIQADKPVKAKGKGT